MFLLADVLRAVIGKRMIFRKYALLAVACLFAASLDAETVAGWNFNSSTLDRTSGSSGSLSTALGGLSLISYQSLSLDGTVVNALPGDPAGKSLAFVGLQVVTEAGDVTITGLNFTGLQDVQFSFAISDASSGLGIHTFNLDYNVGEGWINHGAISAPGASWESRSFDLSSVTGLNGNPDAGLRIRFFEAFEGVDVLSFDNVVVSAAVPEPWIAGFLPVIAILIVIRRLRARAEARA